MITTPSWGSAGLTLDVALQEYHLDFNTLARRQYNEVQGVFKVWRKGNLIAHQFGLFPDNMDGNLPEALALAKSMADETPRCASPDRLRTAAHSEEIEPWLTVLLREVRLNPSSKKARKHARRKTQTTRPHPDHPDRGRGRCRPQLGCR